MIPALALQCAVPRCVFTIRLLALYYTLAHHYTTSIAFATFVLAHFLEAILATETASISPLKPSHHRGSLKARHWAQSLPDSVRQK